MLKINYIWHMYHEMRKKTKERKKRRKNKKRDSRVCVPRDGKYLWKYRKYPGDTLHYIWARLFLSEILYAKVVWSDEEIRWERNRRKCLIYMLSNVREKRYLNNVIRIPLAFSKCIPTIPNRPFFCPRKVGNTASEQTRRIDETISSDWVDYRQMR